jgi:hypothetical protein
MLCALYWCKKHPLVVITDASKDTRYAGRDRAALFTQRRGGRGEDGMDFQTTAAGSLENTFRTSATRRPPDASLVRARHCQDGDLHLLWGVESVRPTEVHDQGIRPATQAGPGGVHGETAQLGNKQQREVWQESRRPSTRYPL